MSYADNAGRKPGLYKFSGGLSRKKGSTLDAGKNATARVPLATPDWILPAAGRLSKQAWRCL